MKRIIIALLALSLVGCQNATQGSGSKQPSQVVIEELPSEAMSFVEDFEYLTEMLYETYPYMSMIQRQEIDINKIIKQYRKKVEYIESREDFYNFVIQFTEEFNNNGHLSVVLKEEFNDCYNSYPKESKWFEILNNKSTMKFYKDYNKKAAPTINRETANNLTLLNYEKFNTTYINIESFDHENIIDDNRQLINFYKEAKLYDNLIIDLRNTSGGSSEYAQTNIIEPLATKVYEYEHYILFKENEYTQPFITSKLNAEDIVLLSSFDHSNFTNVNLDDLETLTHIAPFRHQFNPCSEGYEGNIYVLVGPNNHSASEEFIDFCKTTGFATLIGHETGGNGIGFDPILLPLPHTGIVLRYSTHYGICANGKNNDAFGTTPDVLLDHSENAYDYIMKKLKN